LRIRDLFNINTTPISSGKKNAVEGVMSSIDTSPDEVINTVTLASSDAI
jgi:hypothetical protein